MSALLLQLLLLRVSLTVTGSLFSMRGLGCVLVLVGLSSTSRTMTEAWQQQPQRSTGVLSRSLSASSLYKRRKPSECATTTTTTTTTLFSNLGNSDDESPANHLPLADPVSRLPLMEAELALLTQKNPRQRETERQQQQQDESSLLSFDQKRKELETAIADAKTAAELGVRAAQSRFYDAFSNGDLDAMEQVWSTDSHVRVVHPGMSSIEGREAVLSSWKAILASPAADFCITPARTQVEICGLVAICSCVEKSNQGGGNLEALNIYKREGGTWKMTLHQAAPIVGF